MSNALDSLKQYTTVVSDSGDFESIDAYKPQDATTNPSLILAAVKQEKYARVLDAAVKAAKADATGSDSDKLVDEACDRLLVEFGTEILKLIPGRVSTEVDAKLSYNKEATKAKAKKLIAMYKAKGIEKDRVLIKIASTWQGIQAARELERDEGIHCNLTLLFGFGQAVACAEGGITLISPFVGRILDYYKKAEGKEYASHEDPGVLSVSKIYTYYKQNDYKTIVMGASFRNTGEIEELAGCDFLTIAPALLAQLQKDNKTLERKLSPEKAKAAEKIPKVSFIDDEAAFYLTLAADPMANTKLAEGITKFAEDAETLRDLVAKKIQA